MGVVVVIVLVVVVIVIVVVVLVLVVVVIVGSSSILCVAWFIMPLFSCCLDVCVRNIYFLNKQTGKNDISKNNANQTIPTPE